MAPDEEVETTDDKDSAAQRAEEFRDRQEKAKEEIKEGITGKLGPASVEHHEDGSVTVGGEKVDNPDDFKGEPLPGGPTDPKQDRLGSDEDTVLHGDDDEERESSGDADEEKDS